MLNLRLLASAAVAVASVATFAACGTDSDPAAPASCVPGKKGACTCENGLPGAQACAPDGTEYLACKCDEPGSGGAGGMGGASSSTTTSTGGSPAVTSASTGMACVPGQMIGCTCTDGEQGAQTCAGDGSSYSACVCAGMTGVGGFSSSSSSGSGGTGGLGPGMICEPNTQAPCYDGPAGTRDVGACHDGTALCSADGTTLTGTCNGEVLPATDDCSSPVNVACDNAFPACGATTTWAESFGDAADHQGATGLAVDLAGDVYITGTFTGTMNFGGTALTSQGVSDLYVAGFNPDGTPRWSKDIKGQFGTSAVTTDGAGHVIVAGYVEGLVDFGGGPVPGSDNQGDPFVAAYEDTGTFIWARRFQGLANEAPLLKTDLAGNVYFVSGIGAQPTGGFDFGCGLVKPPSPLNPGAYVVKLSKTNGACMLSIEGGGTINPQGLVVRPRDGHIITSGFFQGTVDFGGQEIGQGNDDGPFPYLYLTEYDTTGVLVGTKYWRADFKDNAALAMDADENIALGGILNGTIDFGNGTPVSGTNGTYIALFDASGTNVWSDAFATFGEAPVSLGWTPTGDLVAIGVLQATTAFGSHSISGGGGSMFLAHLDASGNVLDASAIEGTDSSLLAVDGKGNSILAGGFNSSLTLAGVPLTSAGGEDAFVADVGP